MTIQIRSATPDDAAQIIRLNEAFNDVRSTVDEIRRRLAVTEPIETVLLAELDGAAVGFLCLRLLPQICSTETYAEVSELYIDVEARRHGVGRALMVEATQRSRNAGAKELILLTNFRNTVAQRFYHDQEFENHGLAMRKRL